MTKPKRTGPLAVRVFFTGVAEIAGHEPLMETDWTDHHSRKSLRRLLPHLEKAVEQDDPQQIESAVRRINMLRSIILSIGRILDTETALQLGTYGFVWLDCSTPYDNGGSR
ncbi:MAG: hypothetical protein PVG46_05205 [Desulfobacterales bacterium]|jgi:hypothetical protein